MHPLRILAAVITAIVVSGILALAGNLYSTQAQSGNDCRAFPQTGYSVCGKFLKYWDEHGGLAQQGYPISGVFVEVSELDGLPYTVQYFERAVFEHHPQNPPPYDVLLSQLGTLRGREKYPQGFPSPSSVPFYEERTDPTNAVRSFYNAINRKEYARAYSYFDPSAEKPPLADFIRGYSDTLSVEVYTGKLTVGAAAGNRYASVPAVLVATHIDGSVHTFAACYILHSTNPGVDPSPDAALWKLLRGSAEEDKASTTVANLLARPCAP